MNIDFKDISKEQLENIIKLFNPCMDDYLYVFDLKQDYYRISQHAIERFLIPGDHFYDATAMFQYFVYPEDLSVLIEEIQYVISGEKDFHNLYYRWMDKEHNPVWINCRGRVVCDEDGSPHFLIGCINEIGKKPKADNVSGLLGESSLSEYIGEYKEKIPEGFLMRIGVDDFGSINGNYGMKYGDFILRQVAECIQESIGDNQRLFRVVADEFMIVDFSGAAIDDAVELYKNLRHTIDHFIENNRYQVVFTLSAGIIDTKDIHGGYDACIKLTEFALKETKRNGKNSYYVFEQENYDSYIRKRNITMKLHNSVNHGFKGFNAFYQPIVDAKTARVIGAEALMRFTMQSEEYDGGERVSPVEFIPLLEESGLIIPVGKWILNEAVSVCTGWQEKIPDFKMNINISYVQVMKSGVLNEILSILGIYGIEPASVGIELTESGYPETNFHCLGELNPSFIKIDCGFTKKALAGAYEYELMRHIIDMFHHLGLKICVEGIETEDELSKINKLEPDYIQGYFFGRPCSEEEFYKKYIEKGDCR